ncbi:MAG: hypothetical protein JNL82_34155 [Myxococcales bacterium]|nr:hypothetical protein [Myxococcales bacterium]
MATSDTSPRLPSLSVVTIGHYRHGKTSLTAAITRVLADQPGGHATPIRVQELDRRGGPGALLDPPETTRTVCAGSVRYTTEHRDYVHVDCPGHRPWLKNAARAQALADAAVLVVSAVDSIRPQTHEHLLLARALGLRQLVIFINKCDLVTDLEWLDLVERDIRELLDRCGFDGNTVRILRGAALPALMGDAAWQPAIRDLVEALETDMTVPAHDSDGPPLYYVHAAHDLRQSPRDVVVEGRLRRGTLRRHDRLTLLGFGAALQLRIEDMEVFRQKVDVARAGDRVGLQLHSVDHALRALTTFAGQAVVPRESAATARFRARIDMLPAREGGHPTGVWSRVVVHLLFGAAAMAGTIEVPGGGMVLHGDSAEVLIDLRAPLYLEPGMPFVMRNGNQGAGWKRGAPALWGGTVGSGVVLGVGV